MRVCRETTGFALAGARWFVRLVTWIIRWVWGRALRTTTKIRKREMRGDANAFAAAVFLALLSGCGVAGVTVGGLPAPTATPDPAHELRNACLKAGGAWFDAETLEREIEIAWEVVAEAATTASMTEAGASDQFMRAPPPSQMADPVLNLQNNRVYGARERDRLQAAIDSADSWRIRAQETREAAESLEELLVDEPFGRCDRA